MPWPPVSRSKVEIPDISTNDYDLDDYLKTELVRALDVSAPANKNSDAWLNRLQRTNQ